MAETQAYSRGEIERYLQHKMSQQEMHELEKALMNDPFLADALDGFSSGEPALTKAHLTEIENSIAGHQQKAKVVPLLPYKKAWWKVAAIVLVVATGGAIMYSVINYTSINKNNRSIAASTPGLPNIEKDSVRPLERPMARIDITGQKEIAFYKKNYSPIVHPSVSTSGYEKKDNIIATEPLDIPKGTSPPVAALSTGDLTSSHDSVSTSPMNVMRASGLNQFKGKVVDKSGEPLAFVDIKANNGSLSTASDVNGNFTLKAPDSVINVNAILPGYVSTKAKIKLSKADTIITMKADELSLSEVVVATLSNKNKNPSTTIRVDSSDAATPAGGWKNFQQYLGKKQEFIKGNGSNQKVNGEIELKFLIDKDGRPTEIRVPERMDKPMAERLIEIIRNGPRWENNKKDKIVKVIIGF